MKILVVDLDNIGDVVMASFIPHALKDLYPDSYLTFLVKEYSKDVLVNNPFINELVIFNPPWLGDLLDKRYSWKKTLELLKKLKAAKYDLAIIVNADWKKALLAKLAHIPQRIGHNRKKARFFLTKVVEYKDIFQKHTVEYNHDLVKALGVKEEEIKLEVFIDEPTKKWADNFLNQLGIKNKNIVMGIHPGAGHPARIWPNEHYVALVKKLIENSRVSILVFGSRNDANTKEIASEINDPGVIGVNDISVLQMAALFQRCNGVIAQDSGPMHLATAVGTRVVAIFGPSSPKRFGPYGKGHIIVRKEMDCSPCGSDPDCKKLDCIRNIEIDDVLQAVNLLINL